MRLALTTKPDLFLLQVTPGIGTSPHEAPKASQGSDRFGLVLCLALS